MTDETDDASEPVPTGAGGNGGTDKIVPPLGVREERIAASPESDDASFREEELIKSGASENEWRLKAERRDSERAELFKDSFEIISIIGLWMVFIVFGCFTFVWAFDIVVPKEHQILDDNKQDKLQLIITSGFVAGLASAHIRKRLG